MEFTVVLPLVLLVLLVAVEVTVAARLQLEVSAAAREGARQAATHPSAERAVEAARSSLGPVGAAARVSVRRDNHVGGRAEVVVHLPHRVGSSILGGLEVVLSARAVMRVER